MNRFWVILKITSTNLCKPIYDIINYSTSICPLESGKCGKEGKKLQKSEYLGNKKSFLDEIKNIFHSFWRPIIWWKNKNLITSSRHKLWCFRKYSHSISFDFWQFFWQFFQPLNYLWINRDTILGSQYHVLFHGTFRM